MKDRHPHENPVTTALLLAAGTGSRLFPLTHHAPKCLTLVHGTSILDRLVASLQLHGFKRLVVVTGHLADQIKDSLGDQAGGLEIEYIFNPSYATTNNIHSLWMARHAINESFLLLESDLVFDESLLPDMLCPNKIAVATIKPWMNGTCVTIDGFRRVKAFHAGRDNFSGEPKYKTVNIYCVSHTSWPRIVEVLNRRISAGKTQDYYEVAFAELVADGSLSMEHILFDGKPWFEIDTLEDLAHAEAHLLPNSFPEPATIPSSEAAQSTTRSIPRSNPPSEAPELLNVTT